MGRVKTAVWINEKSFDVVSFAYMELEARSTSRRILAGLAIVLVITAFVLVGLNALMKQQGKAPIISNPFNQQAADDSYIKGYTAARAKYTQLCPLAQTSDPHTLTATITSVGSGKIDVKPTNLDTDPLVDHVADLRSITVSANTTVTKQSNVSPEDFAKQLQAFQAQTAKNTTGTPTALPAPVVSANASTSDLKVGQTIMIKSASEVRLLETIPATSITILN